MFSLQLSEESEALKQLAFEFSRDVIRPASAHHDETGEYPHEVLKQAHEIGLIYPAKAGYDPRAAISFWERMEALGGGAPPEFLSTHPAGSTRIRKLNELMPKAMEVYRNR